MANCYVCRQDQNIKDFNHLIQKANCGPIWNSVLQNDESNIKQWRCQHWFDGLGQTHQLFERGSTTHQFFGWKIKNLVYFGVL